MTYTTELNKEEYQTGTFAERLELIRSKTAPAVGRIEQGNLKNLEAIIAAGLWRDKMITMKQAATATLADPNATAQQLQLANIKLQVVAGFHEAISEAKLANKAPVELGGHSINMNDLRVQQTFGAAQLPGIELVTQAEVSQVMALATFQRQSYPDATIRDIVTHFAPEMLDGQWHELPATHDRAFTVDLLEDLPEAVTIVVQYKENYGDRESAWRHATSLNVHQQGKYRADTPYNGYERRFQWRCEYAITGSVAVL